MNEDNIINAKINKKHDWFQIVIDGIIFSHKFLEESNMLHDKKGSIVK